VLLKLSGEALCGRTGGFGIDPDTLGALAAELGEVHRTGVELAIVVGGGNIFRGLEGARAGMDRAQSDYMGMLATIINGLALAGALESAGMPARVVSALTVGPVAEPYVQRRAIRHLEKGRVVVFTAGTGNPYFSTDTAAALRALEMGAEALFKGTKVDGVYDRDPERHEGAQRYRRLSYHRFLGERLGVMDQTAVTLCREGKLPIRVFKLTRAGSLLRACKGEDVGTLIDAEG